MSLTHNHFATLATALWSTSYVVTKVVAPYYSPAAIGLWRCTAASVVLGIILFWKGARIPPLSQWPTLFLAGLTGVALYLILYNRGQATLGSTTACVVIATSPVITAFLASALFGERLGGLRWLGIVLAFSGVAVMSLWEGTLTLNGGILWVEAAAVSISVYNILQRQLSSRLGSLSTAAYCYFSGTVLLLFFLPATVAQTAAAPLWATALVIGMGIFPSAFGYLCWVKALSLARNTSQVANFMFLTPFFALLLEFAVLSRFPDVGTLIGGGIILGGLALFAWAGRRACAGNS